MTAGTSAKAAALLATLSAAMLMAACGGGGGGETAPTEALPEWVGVTALGGATTNTTGNQSSRGFDTPATNLSGADRDMHLAGDAEFEVAFIKAVSASFPKLDGVGPVMNNTSCVNCHARDGRANFSSAALSAAADMWTQLSSDAGLFLRLSIGDADDCEPTSANRYCAPKPVPGFSTQLFHRGVLNARGDGSFSGQADVYVRFEQSTVPYGDGTSVTLHKPLFQIRNPYDSPAEMLTAGTPPTSRLLQSDVAVSPRMSLPMFGLGLLEAIPEADILALADPDDANGDGISGRANWVYDPVKHAQGHADPRSLGRFGWKASAPSVLAQGANAYRDDIGITNYLFTQESITGTPLYHAYLSANPGDDGQAAGGFEISEAVVKDVTFYSSTLAVPARRNVDAADVRRGASLFVASKCAACHQPSFTTGAHPGIWGPGGTHGVAAVEGQKIYPFTDMLLHDMGEGLADNRRDFLASGREWKTRPLWGIGLTQTVNPLAGFLHDGRARTLEEAILWHGGEAEASKESFRTMSADDRAAMIAFLRSL